MTREEAIGYLKRADVTIGREAKTKTAEALEIAIKALEQEPIIDKIRAEIATMFPPLGVWIYEEGHEVEHAVFRVLSDVLMIIDKYKAESEEA